MTVSPKPNIAPKNLFKPLIIEIFAIAVTGLKIRLNHLKRIPIPISAATQSASMVNAPAMKLLTAKNINAIQTHATIVERIFTNSLTIPFSYPFFIRHTANIIIIKIKTNLKSKLNILIFNTSIFSARVLFQLNCIYGILCDQYIFVG